MDSLNTSSEGHQILYGIGKGHSRELPIHKDSETHSCGALLYAHSSLYLLLPGHDVTWINGSKYMDREFEVRRVQLWKFQGAWSYQALYDIAVLCYRHHGNCWYVLGSCSTQTFCLSMSQFLRNVICACILKYRDVFSPQDMVTFML